MTLRIGIASSISTVVLLVLGFPLLGKNVTSAGGSTKQNAQESKERQGLCYVFLREGALWTACKGQSRPIALPRRASDFAITADGAYFAFKADESPADHLLTIVNLSKGQDAETKTVNELGLLSATCGSILVFQQVDLHAQDVVSLQPVVRPPFKFFRCSSDSRAVAGWTENDERAQKEKKKPGDFYSGISRRLTVIRPSSRTEVETTSPLEFDISPNGKYLAFFDGLAHPKEAPTLCVQDESQQLSCVQDQGGRAAVSDVGAVLYDSEAGIKYWRRGMKKPVVVEKAGARHPEWVTPETAERIRKWAETFSR
jgi:hypothetical protein